MATREAKELYRIRNSFTFKIGIEFVKCLKNPLLFLILPFRALSLLISSRKELDFPETKLEHGIFIIGLDRLGDFHSKQAETLAEIIAKSGHQNVTLLNNSSDFTKDKKGIQWYRIPSVRENNNSRKEWNILAERLLSSAVSISNSSHIIYFGDYLYRGISNALYPLRNHSRLTWFVQNQEQADNLDKSKLPNIETILLPEFSEVKIQSKSIHNLLHKPKSEKFLLFDILNTNSRLIDIVSDNSSELTLTAIQRDVALPNGVNLVVNNKDLLRARLDGKVALILDDYSPILPSVVSLGVPCLLVRTGAKLSPIINEMIRDLELKGIMIVVRRNCKDEILYSINILKSLIEMPSTVESLRSKNTNHTNYVLNWLSKSSNQ